MALWGIDISSHQAGISQATVSNTDVLVVKATEGTGYVNPYFQTHFNFGVAENKKVGVYHFWRGGDQTLSPEYVGTAQADYFLDAVGANQPDFYVLDFEDAAEAANEAGALAFLRRVKERTGSTPWLYTYKSQLVENQYSTIGDEGYPLWLAWYYYSSADGFGTDKDLSFMISQCGLTGWTIAGWQYTDNGRLPGWSAGLDFNLFNDEVFGGSTPRASETGTIFLQPVTGFAVTQNFGDGANLVVNGVKTNVGKGHTGIDFGCPVGTETVALEAGTVLWADWAKNLPTTSWEDRWYIVGGGYGGLSTDAGICIVIDHGSYLSTYSHLSETALEPGDKVRQGQVVGKTGATGFVSGAHLHFEVLPKPLEYQNGYFGRVNPVPYFTQTLDSDSLLTQKDGFDMANIEDVFTTKRAAWGGRNLDEVIKELDRNTWNTKKMTWRLDSLFRIGVPGRFTDGVLGGMLRKLSSYNEGTQGKARQAEYDAASKNNFDA